MISLIVKTILSTVSTAFMWWIVLEHDCTTLSQKVSYWILYAIIAFFVETALFMDEYETKLGGR